MNISFFACFDHKTAFVAKEITYEDYVLFGVEKGCFRYKFADGDWHIAKENSIVVCKPGIPVFKEVLEPLSLIVAKLHTEDTFSFPEAPFVSTDLSRIREDISNLTKSGFAYTNDPDEKTCHYIMDLWYAACSALEKQQTPLQATYDVMKIMDTIREQIKPMTMTESAALFIEEFGIEGTPEAIAEEMNALMDTHYCKDIPLKKGIKEYLNRLHDSGIQMCVASATAVPLVEACLTRLGVSNYFSFMISCETIGIGKSQPDIYYEAAKHFNTAPENIAVYEDALYAAETAKKAGFYVVGVFDESAKKDFASLKEIADEIILEW